VAKQTIDVGTTANDGTGDTLRVAMVKINSNTDELYTANTSVSGMTLDNTGLIVNDTTDLQTFLSGVDHSLLTARGTGVATTYVATVSVGGTTFAVPEIQGEINSDEGYFHVDYAGATGITVANLAASSTYVYLDNAGALQQQTTIPTRQDMTRKIFVMRIGVNPATSTIIGFEYLSNPLGHYANSVRDLYEFLVAQGVAFRKDQVITGRVADLGFDVSAGTTLEFGGTGDINNPNIKSFDAVTNVTYNLMSQTALESSETNLIKSWDNATTITVLGSTTCVAHRVYRFSSGNFAIQYGQGNYANMALAKAGALLEEYVLNPVLIDATFFGWWLLEETATATSGTVDAEFVEYTLGVQGGSSSGLSGALLKGNNLSDVLDAPTARINLGLKIGEDIAPHYGYVDETGSAYTSVDGDLNSFREIDTGNPTLHVVTNNQALLGSTITLLSSDATERTITPASNVTLEGNTKINDDEAVTAILKSTDGTNTTWKLAGGSA
jgi:hypothetical protein